MKRNFILIALGVKCQDSKWSKMTRQGQEIQETIGKNSINLAKF